MLNEAKSEVNLQQDKEIAGVMQRKLSIKLEQEAKRVEEDDREIAHRIQGEEKDAVRTSLSSIYGQQVFPESPPFVPLASRALHSCSLLSSSARIPSHLHLLFGVRSLLVLCSKKLYHPKKLPTSLQLPPPRSPPPSHWLSVACLCFLLAGQELAEELLMREKRELEQERDFCREDGVSEPCESLGLNGSTDQQIIISRRPRPVVC